MALESREIEILLSYVNDPKNAATINATTGQLDNIIQPAKEDVDKVNTGLKETEKQTDRTTTSMRNFGGAMRWAMAGMAMTMIGRTIAQAGQSVINLASTYAKGAPANDEVAQRWAAAMDRIKESQNEIGRTLATQITPYLEKLADLMKQAADFADAHPEAIKAIAGLAVSGVIGGNILEKIGMPLLMTGALLRGAGGISGIGATIGGAGASAGVPVGIGAALSGGIASLLSAIIPVVVEAVVAYFAAKLGVDIYDKLKQPQQPAGFGGMLSEAWGSIKELGFIQMASLGKFTDSIHLTSGAAQAAADQFNKFNHILDDTGNTAQATGVILDRSMVQGFISFEQANNEAAIKYNQQRNKIEEDYAAQRTAIEQKSEADRTQALADAAAKRTQETNDFNANQAQEIRDFDTNEAQSEAAYLAQRLQTVQSDNTEVIRAEQDFQIQMRNLRQQHNANMDDLMASRDALGMKREMRSYNLQVSQATTQHQVEMARMKADNAEKLKEMDAQYAREKTQREADEAQKLKDQQAAFDKQQADEKKALATQLALIETQKQDELTKLKAKEVADLNQLAVEYKAERDKRQAAYAQQLADLGVFTGQLKTNWDKYYADELVKLKAFIANAGALAPGATGGRAGGGYVGSGVYRLHNGEYVLNPQTTRQAERFVGGGLTQAGLVGALAGGGGVTIQSLVMPGTNMNEQQMTRFLRDKFPGELANALQKAKANVPGV